MQLLKEMTQTVFTTTVKKEFKNKRGNVFPVNSKVVCEFQDSRVRAVLDGDAILIPYDIAFKYLNKFKSPPSIKSLEKMVYDGVATTPLGSRTEVDGQGIYGEPSWVRALGLV